MNSTQAFALLKKLNVSLFRTVDVATLLHKNVDAANKLLERLRQCDLLTKIQRGLWAFPETDPYLIPEFITAPFQSYISLQSALFIHGMISQIPETITAVSLDRARAVSSPLGTFSIHHVQADFFFGFEATGPKGVNLALPEKALLDILYLSPARSRLFTHLPELEFPSHFSQRRAHQMIQKITSLQRRSLVEKKFKYLFYKQS